VVEGGGAVGEEARAEVLVALGVGVEDVGFDGGGGGLRGGAVALGVADDGAVFGREPAYFRGGASEVDGTVEGSGVLGGADEGDASGGGSTPAFEEAGGVVDCLVEGASVDQLGGVADGDGFGAGGVSNGDDLVFSGDFTLGG